jgi:hypothetical protein
MMGIKMRARFVASRFVFADKDLRRFRGCCVLPSAVKNGG